MPTCKEYEIVTTTRAINKVRRKEIARSTFFFDGVDEKKACLNCVFMPSVGEKNVARFVPIFYIIVTLCADVLQSGGLLLVQAYLRTWCTT